MYRKNYVPRSKGEIVYTDSFSIRETGKKLLTLLIYIGTFVLRLILNQRLLHVFQLLQFEESCLILNSFLQNQQKNTGAL